MFYLSKLRQNLSSSSTPNSELLESASPTTDTISTTQGTFHPIFTANGIDFTSNYTYSTAPATQMNPLDWDALDQTIPKAPQQSFSQSTPSLGVVTPLEAFYPNSIFDPHMAQTQRRLATYEVSSQQNMAPHQSFIQSNPIPIPQPVISSFNPHMTRSHRRLVTYGASSQQNIPPQQSLFSSFAMTPLEVQSLLTNLKRTGESSSGNKKQRAQDEGDKIEQNMPAITSTLSTRPSPSPPLPPNWNEHLQDTRGKPALVSYKLFPVPSDTLEYSILAKLLHPLEITGAEQIVNPMLWSRFTDTRKDMLRSKSDDLQLLSALGLNDADFIQSAHFSSNFDKDAAVAAYPYNDNMTLLFHCTRSQANVDNILSQGLDERMGNSNGSLGRGIYFSDDPIKSIQYDGCGGVIFIFAVLLGDCLSVDHLRNKNSFVREPEKVPAQKRNFHNFNFDSIVARPTVNRHWEYVVYNRYQCCPLYKIKYGHSYYGANYSGFNVYSQHKNNLPSFSWIPVPHSGIAMPNNLTNAGSPLHARVVFDQMGVREKKDDVEVIQEDTISAEDAALIEEKIGIISNMGFYDTNKILETLKKYDYDVDRSANFLLDQGNDQFVDDYVSRYAPNNRDNDSNAFLEDTATSSMPEMQSEICPICCNEYDTTTAHWSVLKCSHKLCIDCYKHIETTRTTMQGISHTFAKCPFCQGITGIEVGTCPNGTMHSVVLTTPCEGYEQYNTIFITYEVLHSMLRRNVYLPDNDEGNEVLHLLRIAWDRRLCFAIGSSMVNVAENTLVWNIHHKTSQRGGVHCYGFPDPTYFQRVKLELKAYGIE